MIDRVTENLPFKIGCSLVGWPIILAFRLAPYALGLVLAVILVVWVLRALGVMPTAE